MKTYQGIIVSMSVIIFLLLSVVGVIEMDASRLTDLGKFGEDSQTERVQVIFLIAAAASLFLFSKNNRYPELCILMAGCVSIALVREFDALLDQHAFDGAWQTIAGIIGAVTLFYAYKRSDSWPTSLIQWSGTRSFGITITGFLIIFLFSRLFGRKVLWMEIMGEGYQRWVKNAAEEGIELLGYAILLAGIADFLITHYQTKNER